MIAFIAGCGGSGNSISSTSSASDSSAAAKTTGSTAQLVSDVNQQKYDALLKLESWVLNLKDNNFIDINGKRNNDIQAENHRNQLLNIIENVKTDAEAGNYDKAAAKLENSFIPKIDGCNGGNAANDLVAGCELAIDLYEKSNALLETLNNETETRSASRAAAAAWDTYQQEVLDLIGQIATLLANAPDSFFKNPAVSSRQTLLDIIAEAKTALEAQNPDAAQEIIEEEFLPLVDGGRGGETQDDLIDSSVYTTRDYAEAMANVDSIIQLLTLTAIRIENAPATIGVGETAALSAICTYNDSVEKNCSANATWQSSTSAATVAAGGTLTGVNIGPAAITAQLDGLTSAAANVFVIYAGGFHDLFDITAIDTVLWTDVFKGKSTMTVNNGTLRIQAGSYSFGQLVPIQYFRIEPGEKLEIFVTLDPTASAGTYFVQGFGIYNQRTTGIAAGITGGTSMAQPTIYLSSTRGYASAAVASGKGSYKIVYQNRQASLYFNGSVIGTIEADLENQRLTFFLYGSARSNTSLDAVFDNFMTNQTDPGEYKIDIANLTEPFGINGAGNLAAGNTFSLDFYGDPNMIGIMGKLLDADTLQVIQGPFQMTQAMPGKYNYTGVMPSTTASNVVLAASDDSFNSVIIYTRRISTGHVAARAIEKPASTKYIPEEFPAFLLPAELRADK